MHSEVIEVVSEEIVNNKRSIHLQNQNNRRRRGIQFTLGAVIGLLLLSPNLKMFLSSTSSPLYSSSLVDFDVLLSTSSSKFMTKDERFLSTTTLPFDHHHHFRRYPIMPLSELTKTSSLLAASCKMNWIQNKEHNSMESNTISKAKNTTDETTTMTDSVPTISQRIPKIIHQTSKSRCVHSKIANCIAYWNNISTYEYYFHDDEAVWRLLRQDWPEFPHLSSVLACISSMTAISDIWRLLVLWEYGGIYSDLDTTPNPDSPTGWTPKSIYPEDDAYFVVEYYDSISQFWMAVTPRHPIIYYSIQAALSNVLQLMNIHVMDASLTTGPMAVLQGYHLFRKDAGVIAYKPVYAGWYVGTNNQSLRIEGFSRKRSAEILKREAIHRKTKIMLYKAMNMTHFLKDSRGKRRLQHKSCYEKMYEQSRESS
jgi:mannosyltransferase OCH1-like enzyme